LEYSSILHQERSGHQRNHRAIGHSSQDAQAFSIAAQKREHENRGVQDNAWPLRVVST
jgi:hypothetical protein